MASRLSRPIARAVRIFLMGAHDGRRGREMRRGLKCPLDIGWLFHFLELFRSEAAGLGENVSRGPRACRYRAAWRLPELLVLSSSTSNPWHLDSLVARAQMIG